jgi:hypothetical protein
MAVLALLAGITVIVMAETPGKDAGLAANCMPADCQPVTVAFALFY